MLESPRPKTASVVIPVFNYARFVGEAIESALGQTRAPLEVVVVDDGSTDGSRAIISSFGDSIRPVFKENGGHASAFNAGFRVARGDVVFLLDADDVLNPDAVATVLAGWGPDTVMTQSRLELMDARGQPIRGAVPPPWIHLDEGDVRARLLGSGSYAAGVTSGLAFRRDALLRVLPIPEDRFRQAADGYLVRAVAFQGSVQAIQRPLGRYRRHGGNNSELGATLADVAAGLRKHIGFLRSEFDTVRRLAAGHGLESAPGLGEREPRYLTLRLSSVVIDPVNHPVPGDASLRLLPSVLVATARAQGVPLRRRLYEMAAATMVAILPRPLAGCVVAWWHSPASRPRWLARWRRWSTTASDRPTEVPPPQTTPLSGDTHTALRNGLKLGLSLIATWGVGLVVRFWLPRHLGPERFGLLSFAEALVATALGFVSLGVDTYIQKEIPTRPRHASDFYGGALALRVLLAAVLIAGLQLTPLGGREVHALLLAFGAGHLALTLNETLAVLLQANTNVDELALTNVATKLVWGGGMVAGMLLHAPLGAFAAVFATTELLKLAILHLVARRRLALQFRVDPPATWTVLLASAAFYANSLTLTIAGRLDVALMGLLVPDRDVGWYGASQTLAAIILLLTPLLVSVAMPLFARAQQRSRADLYAVMRRVLEALVTIATPVALLLALGAETWIRIAFGAAYGPAAGSLRALAPLFILIYGSTLLSMAQVVQGRGWRLTAVSLLGIAVNASAALVLVPLLWQRLGPGGAGTGMALAAVAREVFVCACLFPGIGPHLFDAPRRRLIFRTVLAAVAASVVHVVLAGLGPSRLGVDLVVYLAIAIGLGALRPAAILALVRELAGRAPGGRPDYS